MNALVDAKRSFYRQEDVAQAYDAQRFGGASGEYVNARELRLTLELLPAWSRLVADVGCGTGRLLPLLRTRAGRVLGLDASAAMLAEARTKAPIPQREPSARLPLPLGEGRGEGSLLRTPDPHLSPAQKKPPSPAAAGEGRVRALTAGQCDGAAFMHTGAPARVKSLPEGQGTERLQTPGAHPGPLPEGQGTALLQADAFALPLASGSCHALTCMRVLFHFADVRPLLRELRRIAKPGGVLVCDTSAWSPRGLIPLGRERWGERVSPLSARRFRSLAQECGWQVREERRAFLISPYMYRRLPLPAALALEGLEPRLPAPLRCRLFWSLTAV